MHTRRAIAIAFVSLTVTQMTATWASAQDPQPAEVRRPYRGIFGGPADPNSPHSLTFTGSVFAAYDDNVLEALSNRRAQAPWLQKRGEYQGANAGLAYAFTHDGPRFDFGGRTSAHLNYFRHEERSDALPAYHGDLMFGVRITEGLTFTARQSAAYTSTYNQTFGPAAGADASHAIGTPGDVAFDLFEMPSFRTASSLQLGQRFGRYTSVQGAYQFRTLRVERDENLDSRFRDYDTHSGSVGVLYNRPVTRYASLRLGYSLRASDRGSRTGEPRFLHHVDAGLDYGRALSFSRRTSISFGTGSAIAVTEPVAPPDGEPADGRTRVRLTGRASLLHEMGRTWTAHLTYGRGFQNHEGLDELYFTDSVEAGVGGLFTRRLSFAAAASWADSSLEHRSLGGRQSRSASAQLQYGLSRYLALYARYIYYHYRYSDNISLDERFPRQLDRHGVRVGLTTSVPLIR